MSETCIVPNCNSKHEFSDKPVAFFNLPENVELRNKWLEAVPKTSIPLDSTAKVCEKHFLDSDVIRHYADQSGTGNAVDKVAHYPRLVDTAVPSIFPGFQLRSSETILENSPRLAEEILSDTAENIASDSRPLISNDARHNDAIPGEAANRTTNPRDYFQKDNSPITSDAVPISVQPTSTSELNDTAANDSPRRVGCDCCGCTDPSCYCDCCGHKCSTNACVLL